MPQSIAVFGAGPGLGHAVARRYAQDGYDVVLVARRREPLEALARELTSAGQGTTAHVITADLTDTDAIPALADQIRATAGDLDALYYAPTPEDGFFPAASLTPQRARAFMPLVFYSLVALVQEFLPHMLASGDGAIVTAQGVYVGMLYVGAIIEESAFHTWLENAKATGAETRDWGPAVAPAHLADLLRDMHKTKAETAAIYPAPAG